MNEVDYQSSVAPQNYRCSKCCVGNVKLWRQYQTFLNHIELLCAECSMKDQDKSGEVEDDGKRDDGAGQRTDSIGWLVPAIPTEDGKTYWGYTSVPEPGCQWWRSLPVRPGKLPCPICRRQRRTTTRRMPLRDVPRYCWIDYRGDCWEAYEAVRDCRNFAVERFGVDVMLEAEKISTSQGYRDTTEIWKRTVRSRWGPPR